MKLHTLKPKAGATKKKMRVGRGNASGKGTYSTRGCKGQGQRKSGNVRPGFEGGQTPLIMRLPKLKGFKSPKKPRYQTLNVYHLNLFEEGQEVNMTALKERGLIRDHTLPVKLLGKGTLNKKVDLRIRYMTDLARKKVEEAGGKVFES